MSRAGRQNHKRAYWLRGKILRWVRDLAFREGILTVERNPMDVANVPTLREEPVKGITLPARIPIMFTRPMRISSA